MNDVTVFSFDASEIRTLTDKSGDPWFVAADVCRTLGLDATAVRKLDDDERDLRSMQTLGGSQEIGIINESGLYTLILRCRDATTPGTVPHRFRKWVTSEVLPSIRKTGGYQSPPRRQSEVDIEALKLSPIAARAAKAFGFKGNMATLSADNAVRRITGSSPLALFGQSALKADDQDALLIVTEIANRLGIKAREVNPLLTKSGLQTEYRDAKGKLCYEMTETGKAFGVFVDTGKGHGDGTPVRQLKWRASVVTFLVGQVRIDPA